MTIWLEMFPVVCREHGSSCVELTRWTGFLTIDRSVAALLGAARGVLPVQEAL